MGESGWGRDLPRNAGGFNRTHCPIRTYFHGKRGCSHQLLPLDRRLHPVRSPQSRVRGIDAAGAPQSIESASPSTAIELAHRSMASAAAGAVRR